MLLTGLLACGCGLHAAGALAQAPEFERFDTGDGLPNNTVHALHTTEDGFLWVGTTDGLARWDGYRFEVFRRDLPSTHVKAIDDAPDGDLFVLTHDGLVRWNPRTGRPMREWPFADAQAMLVLSDQVWVQASGSVFRIRSTVGVPVRVQTDADVGAERIWGFGNVRTSPERTWGLMEWGGDIWMSSPGDGIIRMDPETLEANVWPWPQDIGPGVQFPGLFRWNDQLIVSHAEGAFSVSVGEGGAPRFSPLEGERFAEPWHAITGHVDGTGAGVAGEWVTIGTDFGIVRGSGSGERILVEAGPTRELSNVVLAAATLPDGSTWLGTRNGLYRMRTPAAAGSQLFMEGVPVLSLARAPSSTDIWVGTFGQGVYRMHSEAVTASPSGLSAAEPVEMGACNPTVWTLFIDAAQRVWAGTDGGLCLWDASQERFDPVSIGEGVHAIAEHPEGTVLVGTTKGLCKIQAPGGDDGEQHPVNWKTECTGPEGHVQGLEVDSAGALWMALFDGRVFRDGTELEGVTVGGEGGWMISDVGAAVAVSGASGLTMVTGDGRAHTFLADHIVYGATTTSDGTLWASTSKGLFRASEGGGAGEEGWQAADFEPIGALQSEFNRRAILAVDSVLFIGGMDGLTRLDRVARPAQLNLVVTRVDVVGRDSSYVLPSLPNGGLELAHDHVSFEMEFSALGGRESLVYRYRLEGFDTNWNTPPARTARYTNLPPGDYLLRAEARGPAATAELSIPIHVRTAWFATWWFRLGVLALILAAAGTGWRLRQAHLDAMARIRSRIASDLHDDVGSRLAGIALLSELVASSASLPGTESDRLETISKTARELVTSVRDISWLAHPSNDQIQDLADRMREAAQALLGDRTWELRADAEHAKDRLSLHVRRHVFLVFKEALHNIGRHAGPTAEVDVRLGVEGTRLVLVVSDTGAGFLPSAAGTGQGLRNMADRAREVGGTLDIRSAVGEGTTITLSVPL
ncbi:MAG: two-component regulator propeller domain-containing protein [Rhodothermales bacterium]